MEEKQVIQFAKEFLHGYFDRNMTSLLPMMHPHICWSPFYNREIIKGVDAVLEMLIQEAKQGYIFVFDDVIFYDVQFSDSVWHMSYKMNLGIKEEHEQSSFYTYGNLSILQEKEHILLTEVSMSLFETEKQMIDHIVEESHAKQNYRFKAIQYEDILRLKQVNDDLEVLTDNIPGGIFKCLYDEKLTIRYMSEGFLSMFGYTRKDIEERFHNSFWEMIVLEDRQITLQEVQRQMALGKTKQIEYRVIHKDGHPVWVLDKGQLIEDVLGGFPSFHCIIIDITEEKVIREELKLSLERYDIIMNQTDDIIVEWDIVHGQVRFSRNWKNVFDNNIFKLHNQGLDNQGIKKVFHPDDIKKVSQLLDEINHGKHYIEKEVRIINKQQKYQWWKLHLTAQFDKQNKPLRAIGVIIDIDEEKRRSQYLLRKAQQDALTGIYNKITTQNLIKDYLAQMSSDEICAMMIIDIDNFKEINDFQGHLFGDAILSDIARRMKNNFSDKDIIGRIGGDEFLIFFKDVQNREMIQSHAQKMLNQMQLLEESHGDQLHISCSIGVSIAPQDGIEFTELFQKADRALYQAKNEGKKQFVIFDESITQEYLIFSKPRSYINETIDSNERNRISGGQFSEYVFRVLYNSSDVGVAVKAMLEIVGLQFDVSRVYIFENVDNDLYCCNTFEWCNQGVEPQIDSLKHVSYEKDLGGHYIDNFNEEGIFYCSDIKQLPKLQYQILAPQGIKSMLQCAIKDNGHFKGYVGFDECRKNRYWTQDQIDVLVFISEILSIFLLKTRAETALKREKDGLLNLLDNQSSWIYVIDPKDYQMLFINKRTKEICPQAKEGMPCYQVVMQRETPCEFCPVKNIKGDCTNQKLEVYNPYFNLWVDVDATYVKWQGQDAIMLSCHDVTAYKK